jgi:hypothetical protein
MEVSACSFPVPLACEHLLQPTLLAGLQIEGVALHVLDDSLLQNLPFEAPQGVF